MSAEFEMGTHYRCSATVSRLEIDHTHWHKEDMVLTSLLNMGFYGYSKDGLERSVISTIDVWDVSVDELRGLAGMLVDAAEMLEAHQQQLQEGGAA